MKTFFIASCFLLLLYSCSDTVSGKKNGSDAATVDTPALSPEKARRLRAAVTSFMDSSFNRSAFNGAVLVAYKGQIVYEQYGGVQHYRHGKDSITGSSPFHLASVSKTITAMAVLQLVQAGKIQVNDEVAKYLNGFPLAGVTVKTLLNHRSGLPNYVHYMERLGWDRKRRITNQDVLDFIINRHEEIDIARPDSRFNYSNTNYALLALIIEKVTGKSYGDYLKEKIFIPLDMRDTYVFTLADSARSMPSYFYNGRQYAFDYLDLVYGDKNIYSTPRDLLKFDRALVKAVLVSQPIQDSAYQPYSFEKPGTHNYGLGWRMLLLKNGKKVIYHNGWWHGNRAAFYRLLEEDATIIALCNNDSKMIYSTKKLADLFGAYFQSPDSSGEEDNSTVQSRPTAPKKKNYTRNRRQGSRSLAAKK